MNETIKQAAAADGSARSDGSITVGVAVVLIIVLNAAAAFDQERHAENVVEALGRGVQQPLPAVGDRGRARDRRRGRVRPTV